MAFTRGERLLYRRDPVASRMPAVSNGFSQVPTPGVTPTDAAAPASTGFALPENFQPGTQESFNQLFQLLGPEIQRANSELAGANYTTIDPTGTNSALNRIGREFNTTATAMDRLSIVGAGAAGGYADELSGLNLGEDYTNAQSGIASLGGEFGSGAQDIYDRYMQMSRTGDPRFAQYRDAQFQQYDLDANKQRTAAMDYLARNGITGGAALQELANIDRDLAVRRQGLSGELGLAEMGREDSALGSAFNALSGRTSGLSSLFGQGAGLEMGRQNFNAQNIQGAAGIDMAGRGLNMEALRGRGDMLNRQANVAQTAFGNTGTAAAFNNDATNQQLENSNAQLQNVANLLGIDTSYLQALSAGQMSPDLMEKLQMIFSRLSIDPATGNPVGTGGRNAGSDTNQEPWRNYNPSDGIGTLGP